MADKKERRDDNPQTQRNSTICELTFHGMVVSVRMNRKRLVVMLEEIVFIYDISNMKLLHQQLTPLNPTGICALSPSSDHNFLALPHCEKSSTMAPSESSHVPKSIVKESISGDVLLYDLNKMSEVSVIQAHQTPVSHMAMNPDGTMLATSSEKGTVIRIFSIPDGKKLYQFRRGSIPARIYSMTFNATSTLLCVSSATETVHVFKIAAPGPSAAAGNGSDTVHEPRRRHGSHTTPPPGPTLARSPSPSTSETPSSLDREPAANTPPRQPRPPGFMSLLRRTSQGVSTNLVTRAAGYLPHSVTELWEPQRDFAWCRVPRGRPAATATAAAVAGGGTSSTPVRSVVAMGNSGPHVLVATNEGDFYIYHVDLEKGGEGTLIQRFEYGKD